MSNLSRKEQVGSWLRVGDLVVFWPTAQRELAESKAAEIAATFDADAFGTILVSPLPDGKYHVNDGWTRVTAVRTMFGDNERVPCTIVPAGTARRAAEIFDLINGKRTKPSAMQAFFVKVTACRLAECTVSEIVRDLGLAVENSNSDGAIRAVGALMSIFRLHGVDGLRNVLMMIKDCWGRESAGFDAHIMRGFGLFLAAEPDARIDKLTRKIARKFTPGRLVGAAKATREAFGGSMSRAVCALIQEVHTPGGRMAPPQREMVVQQRGMAV